MKRNRIISLLLAVTLLISLCCTGCAKWPGSTITIEAPTTEVPAEPAEEPGTDEENGIPVRMQNGGWLSFLPEEPLSIPKLSEMPYVRPDAEKLIAAIEALTEKVPGCNDAQALLNDYYPIAVQIYNFYTMQSLACFHYYMDTSDSFFAEEYDFLNEQAGVESEAESALYAAFAASPCRDDLEKAYFGEGFFLDYDDFNAADESYFDLQQQENDLVFQYHELTSKADYSSYSQILRDHDAAGQIFIELVKVRQKIAEAKGYANYMDYSYACGFKRDYTTAQAREYLSMIKTVLAPLVQDLINTDQLFTYFGYDKSKAMELLCAAAEKMGGPVWEAFRFMVGYELYDISDVNTKRDGAYMDYLQNYQAPIIFIGHSWGDVICSLVHEFGHYCDYYFNYGVAGGFEIAETYSQAMEYLSFAYAEPLLDGPRASCLRAALWDMLTIAILQEGAYADFELQVYALSPEELTVEHLDAIFGQCMEDYGIAGMTGARSKSYFWSAYHHFFDSDGYVISYSVSAVAAMQICRLEAEKPGAGVDAFCRLLNRTHGKKFAAVLAEVGLDSPFEEATLGKTAEFLKDTFNIN